jgi:hypothetical protein
MKQRLRLLSQARGTSFSCRSLLQAGEGLCLNKPTWRRAEHGRAFSVPSSQELPPHLQLERPQFPRRGELEKECEKKANARTPSCSRQKNGISRGFSFTHFEHTSSQIKRVLHSRRPIQVRCQLRRRTLKSWRRFSLPADTGARSVSTKRKGRDFVVNPLSSAQTSIFDQVAGLLLRLPQPALPLHLPRRPQRFGRAKRRPRLHPHWCSFGGVHPWRGRRDERARVNRVVRWVRRFPPVPRLEAL